MTWMPRRRWLVAMAAILGVLFVVKTIHWASIGGPLGFTLGSCVSNSTGRWISATSDHLLDSVALSADGQMAVIDLGRRQVVVRGDLATVDRKTRAVIPHSCEKVDVEVWGERIQILADGRALPLLESRADDAVPAPSR
jgi:hypothetical protein